MSNDLAGLITFILTAVFFAFDARDGLVSGNAGLLFTRARKADHPVLFWYGIALSSSLAIISLALAVYYFYRWI